MFVSFRARLNTLVNLFVLLVDTASPVVCDEWDDVTSPASNPGTTVPVYEDIEDSRDSEFVSRRLLHKRQVSCDGSWGSLESTDAEAEYSSDADNHYHNDFT